MKLPSKQFEKIVWDAYDNLPQSIRSQIHNLEILIERQPSPKDYAENDIPDDEDLFGLYIGVPLTERAFGYDLTLPDQIIIFQRPHEDECDNLAELKTEVARTLRHEIAHYFGISDARLDELGAY